jgi:hypothetical protein
MLALVALTVELAVRHRPFSGAALRVEASPCVPWSVYSGFSAEDAKTGQAFRN